MRLISSRSRRFSRSYDYALPGANSMTPRAAQTILVMRPKERRETTDPHAGTEARR